MAGDDVSDDTNFFWQGKYGGDWSGTSIDQLIDGSDALANSNFTIAFQHVASKKTVFFKAFVTKYSEDFNSEWSPTTAFGRTDPIYTFSNTRRVISLGFSVPASSESEAYENMGRVQRLIQFLYPTYYNTGTENDPQYALGQSPLVRLKMMNLIQKPGATEFSGEPMDAKLEAQLSKMSRSEFADFRRMGMAAPGEFGRDGTVHMGNLEGMEQGLLNGGAVQQPEWGVLGAITNCSVTQELDKDGVLEAARGVIYPKNYNVSLTFNAIHEHTQGFNEDQYSLEPTFPYGAILKPAGADKVSVDSDQSYNNRINKERNMQAAEDLAKAKFSGMFGGDGIFGKEGGMPHIHGRQSMAEGRAEGRSYFLGMETTKWDFWDKQENQIGAGGGPPPAQGSIEWYMGQEAKKKG